MCFLVNCDDNDGDDDLTTGLVVEPGQACPL